MPIVSPPSLYLDVRFAYQKDNQNLISSSHQVSTMSIDLVAIVVHLGQPSFGRYANYKVNAGCTEYLAAGDNVRGRTSLMSAQDNVLRDLPAVPHCRKVTCLRKPEPCVLPILLLPQHAKTCL